MKLKDFLSHIPNNELTSRLMLLDKSVMELHQNNYYVVSDMADIEVINDEITLASFKNKVDYIKQEQEGFNSNGDKQDILEMCSIGICAFNRFNKFYTNKEFISYLIDNLDMFLENGKIPKMFQEYYIDVFMRGNIDYINNFALNYNNDRGNNKNSSLVYTKSTAVGRAFSDKENGYAKILLLPAVLCLVFLIVIVVYFIFYR